MRVAARVVDGQAQVAAPRVEVERARLEDALPLAVESAKFTKFSSSSTRSRRQRTSFSTASIWLLSVASAASFVDEVRDAAPARRSAPARRCARHRASRRPCVGLRRKPRRVRREARADGLPVAARSATCAVRPGPAPPSRARRSATRAAHAGFTPSPSGSGRPGSTRASGSFATSSDCRGQHVRRERRELGLGRVERGDGPPVERREAAAREVVVDLRAHRFEGAAASAAAAASLAQRSGVSVDAGVCPRGVARAPGRRRRRPAPGRRRACRSGR